MAKHTTQKTGPTGRAKTLAIRKARAAKLGAIRTTRAGRIAR